MRKVLILTGPPGAGKNTIAQELAKRLKQCAIIDVDLVRWMVVQPHRAPWDGREGKRQQMLGVRNACILAASFDENNFTVIILDVLSQMTKREYEIQLKRFKPHVVKLLPTYNETVRRNRGRQPRLRMREIKMLYEQQMRLICPRVIDNTRLSVRETVEKILTVKGYPSSGIKSLNVDHPYHCCCVNLKLKNKTFQVSHFLFKIHESELKSKNPLSRNGSVDENLPAIFTNLELRLA